MNRLLQILFILLIYSLLFVGFFHPVVEMTQDLGRHLLTGEIILQTKSIPSTNLFSYTYPSFPFINHHWLSEVLFYETFVFFSYHGLFILKIFLILSAFSLVFFYAIKKEGSVPVVITSILYIFILFERTHIRPELFSFLFLSLFIFTLYKFREKYTLFIFTLILIQFVWVNAHIYFIIGLSTIFLFLLDSLATNYIKAYQKKYEFPSPRLITLGLLLAGVLLSSLLNPNFLSGVLYPFTVFQNYGYSIEENQNIFFLWEYAHKPTIAFFAISSTLLFVLLLLAGKKARVIDWLLSICFTYLAIMHIRNFPLFVFATFIPFSHALSVVIQKFSASKDTPYPRSILVKYCLVLTFIGVFLWQIQTVVTQKSFGYRVEPGGSPAADFFLKEKLTGPLFNNFDIGSYLEYRLYPKERVFIDGRPEAYPSSFFQKTYIPMQENSQLFEQVSNQYHFNTIFFAHTDQTPWAQTFLKSITNNKDWKMIYLDETAVLFVKNATQNQKIIKNHIISEQSFEFSKKNKNNAMSLYRLSRFFDIVGWDKKTNDALTEILYLDPNNCFALSYLANSPQTSPSLQQVYSIRYTQACN